MIKSIIDADYNTADAIVIGVPYEHTISFGTGTKNGPAAVFDILDTQVELFDRYSETEPVYKHSFGSRMLDVDINDLNPEEMVKHVQSILEKESRFVLLIGGEHNVTIPALKALKAKYPTEPITIVQIDAHFDLREDDSEYNEKDPSRYAHSTVMRHAYDLGFNILPVGIRTFSQEEFAFTKQNSIHFFEWGRYDKPTPSHQEIIDAIQTEKVYITIDVDGFDPCVMPATGTPVPGGLSWTFGEGLLLELLKQKDVIGADIVEVAPVKHSGQTEYNAGQLAYHILVNHTKL